MGKQAMIVAASLLWLGGVAIAGDRAAGETDKGRLQMALDTHAIGGIVIKVNQIGSLWEALETMRLAREHGIALFIKHRSGETNDDFIADLAFASGAFALMAGAPQRGERVAKYNRLWEIVST